MTIDYETILECAVVPRSMREAVIALAKTLADSSTREAKSEIVQFCLDNPSLSAAQISLAVARSLHSTIPLSQILSTDSSESRGGA